MIRYSIEKHACGFPSKVAASAGSPHIYNIRLTKDHDNASLVGKGDWIAFDEYEEAEVPTFAGKIQEQAANGNWYIEVTADTELDDLKITHDLTEKDDELQTFSENLTNGEIEVVALYMVVAWYDIQLNSL